MAPPAWHPAAAAMPCSGALPHHVAHASWGNSLPPGSWWQSRAGSQHSTPRDRRTAGDAAAPGSNARHEREILGGLCPAGETGVLGYGDSSSRRAVYSAFTLARTHYGVRSEERRVGKECRSRWAACAYRKKYDEGRVRG